MNAVLEKAYDDKVLDEKVHSRLIQDIDRIAAVANIPVTMILKAMKESCTEEEIEWVKHIRNREEDDKLSLAYVGVDSPIPIESRMMAIAGACVRNFIDARMYTVQDVLFRLKDGKMPDPTVLMIPNFFISKNQGGQIASWDISSLLGLLITRLSSRKVTILYIDDLKHLEAEYGKPFVQHIKSYYHLIT